MPQRHPPVKTVLWIAYAIAVGPSHRRWKRRRAQAVAASRDYFETVRRISEPGEWSYRIAQDFLDKIDAGTYPPLERR